MAKKILFGNYKGGVGKTTSSYNIAKQLVMNHQKKVLLVDLDPQSSLSSLCLENINSNITNLLDNETLNFVYDIYWQSNCLNMLIEIDSNNIVQNAFKNAYGSLDFIPNSLFYKNGGLDSLCMKQDNNIESLLILRNFVEKNGLNGKYDYIFFDTPPSNNIITQGAFLYSDYFIIPTIMDYLSVRGVQHYISVIKTIYEEYCKKSENANLMSLVFGKEPIFLGVFESLRKPQSKNQEEDYRDQLKNTYNIPLFDTIIRNLNAVSQNIGVGEYPSLAEEFLKRISEVDKEV